MKAETTIGITHSPKQAAQINSDVNVPVHGIKVSIYAKRAAQIGDKPIPLITIPVQRAHSIVSPNGNKNPFEIATNVSEIKILFSTPM